MTKTAWRAVTEALEAEGVRYVFGLPGNPQHLIEDLTRSSIEFVLVRDEPSAVDCAFAHARLTGRPAVCFSNPGPGITNLVTGLGEATSASVPVVAIANGVVERHDGMGAFQELDGVALMKPVTKWATRIVDPRKTPWTLQRAFSLAANGRPGGVYVELASDTALEEVEMAPYRRAQPRLRTRPDPDAVEAAAARLAGARRPIIVCGSGAVSAGASAEIRRLAAMLGAPVFTTPGGRGVIAEDDDLAMGLIGIYFTEVGKGVHDAADVVLSIGSRLEAFSTNSWQQFPEGAAFIQLDLVPEAIGLNFPPDAALVGDAALAAADLAAALEGRVDAAASRARIDRLVAAKAAYLGRVEADAWTMETPVRPPLVVAAVNRVFGRDTVLVKENGGADLWCYYWPYYRVLDAGDCVPMGEQTAMGLGIIGTIGAKLARPDKKVVCITGDGAMLMAMKELATAAENRCGVTWVVMNNQSLGWVQYTQHLKNQPPVGTDFRQATDLVAVAEAQGCRGLRATTAEDVVPALEAALTANAAGIPALVDVRVARHVYPPHFVAVHRQKLVH